MVATRRLPGARVQIPSFNRSAPPAGFRPPAGRLELIHDRDDVAAGVSLRIREDPDEPLHPRLETGLLANLADDRLDRRLAEFDEAARQRGHSPIRFVLPTDRDEFAVLKDEIGRASCRERV